MMITSFKMITSSTVSRDLSSRAKFVVDAFEEREYGSFIRVDEPKKRPWETVPSDCRVTLPSGEEKQCRSLDEFDGLIKVYMEN